MGWRFQTSFLEEIANHYTLIGKLWLILFIVFRIVLVVVAGMSVYHDEQSMFVCNTEIPGCKNVCYDAFAPFSYVRFLVFQIVMINTPPIVYLGFATHKIARMDDDEHEHETDGRKKHDGRRMLKRYGLMKVYVMQLLLRVAFEVAFLFGQYMLYGFKVSAVYECTRSPCIDTVDCYVSRATEKTILLYTMYTVSSICLLLTMIEILYLSISGIRDACQGHMPLELSSDDVLEDNVDSSGQMQELD